MPNPISLWLVRRKIRRMVERLIAFARNALHGDQRLLETIAEQNRVHDELVADRDHVASQFSTALDAFEKDMAAKDAIIDDLRKQLDCQSHVINQCEADRNALAKERDEAKAEYLQSQAALEEASCDLDKLRRSLIEIHDMTYPSHQLAEPGFDRTTDEPEDRVEPAK